MNYLYSTDGVFEHLLSGFLLLGNARLNLRFYNLASYELKRKTKPRNGFRSNAKAISITSGYSFATLGRFSRNYF